MLLELRELEKLGSVGAKRARRYVEEQSESELATYRENGMTVSEIADLMMVLA